MPREEIRIPDRWRALDLTSWTGNVLIVGGSDSGKSTFARHLYARLLEAHPAVAFLDLDVGQNSFGLPGTVAVARNRPGEGTPFPPRGSRRVCFVGSNTPVRHLLEMTRALHRILAGAPAVRGVEALVVDTTGFVSASYGGMNLKWTQVEMLRPCTVVAFQSGEALRTLLEPLRRLPDVRVVALPVPDAVRRRSSEERRAYRTRAYRSYFQGASTLTFDYPTLAVFPEPDFQARQLVGLEDREGFVLALALVERVEGQQVQLRTPLGEKQRDAVVALRLGDLRVDRDFNDRQL